MTKTVGIDAARGRAATGLVCLFTAFALATPGGCSRTRGQSCPGTCSKPSPTHLEILAGQPGGAGWVDGPLAAAHFNEPWALAGDGRDHIYVADVHVIRSIDMSSGTVSTLAGDHRHAGAIDGVGAQATFNAPCGLAYADGKLYVSDTENHTIRRVDVGTGAVSTLAGAPRTPGAVDAPGLLARFREPEGLALDPGGDLYIGDTDNNTIRVLSLGTGAVRTLAGTPEAAGNADGIGAAARFSKPKGLALDGAGRLYVIDALNESVRRVTIATGAVSTFATFKATPQGLAVKGDVVLVALTDHRIVRLSADGAVLSTVGTGSPKGGFVDGPFATARFSAPAGLLLDAAGTAYVADLGNSVIRTLSLSRETVSTYAGARSAGGDDGVGTNARFSAPQGIAADESAVFVADTGNSTIRKISLPTGEVTTVAGAAGQASLVDGALRDARFNHPTGLALDPAHATLYVADTQNRTIRQVDLRGGKVTTLALARTAGDPFASFDAPSGLAFDDGRLFATDYSDHFVAAIDLKKGLVSTLAGTYGVPGRADGVGTKAGFYGPMGITADGHGSLFVSDDMNETVRKIDIRSATVSTLAGRPVTPGSNDGVGGAAHFHFPMGIASDGLGDAFVADNSNSLVRLVNTSTGEVTTIVGTLDASGVRLGPLPAQLARPAAIALTTSGGLLVTSENAVLLAR